MSEAIERDALLRLQKLAAIGEVSVGVSHETRNLLAAISGFVQLARQRAQDPEAVRLLVTIERETARCMELLEHHLELVRVDADASELVDVASLVDTVAQTVVPQVELARLSMRADLPEHVPSVRGRRGELQQVLLNLLINAMHATPQGGHIAIAVAHRMNRIEIAVSDSGPGVPIELRERIFEPFFTTKREHGTGLGLALCRRIITAHGGTLELDPTAPGARFVVQLPAVA